MHTPSLQHLPPSTLLLIANALAPPTLKHTFRLPGHRTAHCSLLAASLTCHALRSVCFPLAIQVFRSPALRPQAVADLGESVRELEARLDFLLDAIHLWPHVRKLDIEIYARAPQRLVAKLATLLTFPHLSFISLKLPTYRVFRDALVKDLRGVIKVGSGSVRTLCVDACAGWMLAFFPRVCEVVVWSWPSEVDREGGLSPEQTICGWRTFLAGLSAQAPCVEEVEVGGLSIYDVNELFPSLANYLQHTTALRILHRKEEFGALPLSHPSAQTIHPRTLSSIYALWEDTLDDDEYEGQLISGCPGAVRRIVYFDLQEECGACYVPGKRGRMWVDDGPAVVLSLKSLEGRD